MTLDSYTLDPEAEPDGEPLAIIAPGQDEDAAAGEVVVVEYGHRVKPEDLPGSVGKYLKWMSQNPVWKIDWQMSVTDHGDIHYASKERKGDVKTPAHFEEHIWLRGYLIAETKAGEKMYVARFTAEWVTKINPETDKGRTSFVSAVFWDTITEEQRYESSLGPFQTWLGTLAPVGKINPVVRKPKAEPQPMTIQQELESGEWNAEG